ncbi:MAG: hypothetical protein C4530_10125 [Desulfobacteraceae bacterium]|nr:MAG: hypothetical protein C4530_10125 [Desulfobacteraceae bacterium]
MPRMISVPETLIEKISKAGKAFQELEDELEDYLLISDQTFIEKMRRSRESHVEGDVRPFSLLKSEQCID